MFAVCSVSARSHSLVRATQPLRAALSTAGGAAPRPDAPPASASTHQRTASDGGGPDAAAAASTAPSPQSTRMRALSLYRQLLRGAERMPTPNRQNFIKRRTRDEYRKHRALTDPEEIDFQLRLADTNLDTVLVQAEHLSRLFNDPEYQNYN